MILELGLAILSILTMVVLLIDLILIRALMRLAIHLLRWAIHTARRNYLLVLRIQNRFRRTGRLKVYLLMSLVLGICIKRVSIGVSNIKLKTLLKKQKSLLR